HAHHDARVRAPRPAIRAQLGRDRSPRRGEGRGLGVSVRVTRGLTMKIVTDPIQLVSPTFRRQTLDRILTDAKPFIDTGHFLYPADEDGNHTKGFFAFDRVARSPTFVDSLADDLAGGQVTAAAVFAKGTGVLVRETEDWLGDGFYSSIQVDVPIFPPSSCPMCQESAAPPIPWREFAEAP